MKNHTVATILYCISVIHLQTKLVILWKFLTLIMFSLHDSCLCICIFNSCIYCMIERFCLVKTAHEVQLPRFYSYSYFMVLWGSYMIAVMYPLVHLIKIHQQSFIGITNDLLWLYLFFLLPKLTILILMWENLGGVKH